ncbi:hypothetical protein LCGC14_2853380, partial [marine sediment metagenome]
VDKLEQNAEKDRDKFTQTADNIYNEIKTQTAALNNFRVHSTEEFVSKDQCRDHRESLTHDRG